MLRSDRILLGLSGSSAASARRPPGCSFECLL